MPATGPRADRGRANAGETAECIDLAISDAESSPLRHMAGLAINPVQVFRTGLPLHWEFLRLWTGFELPSSCADLP
jgi:hypothetical protein